MSLASTQVSVVLVPSPQVALASFLKALPYGSCSRLVLLCMSFCCGGGGRQWGFSSTQLCGMPGTVGVCCLCPPRVVVWNWVF